MTAMVSSMTLFEGVGAGRVEFVVGLAGPALVPGDDGEVLLERGEVVAHGAHLGTTGAAGQEEQHRVVGAVAANHEVEVVAVDVDGGEFGDRAGDGVAVRVDDRVGGGGACECDGEADQPECCEHGDGSSHDERPPARRSVVLW